MDCQPFFLDPDEEAQATTAREIRNSQLNLRMAAQPGDE
jgi:hypothetical protein